jgi:hypothetical protein
MRQGWTIVPAGLALALVLTGAGRSIGAPPADRVAWLDDRFGLRVTPIYLLLRPDVQADLQLSPHQIEGARAKVGQLVERLFTLRGKSGKAAMAAKQDIDETAAEWLRHELSEAQQERLTQVTFQWEGAAALQRPSIIEDLGIVEVQELKVKQLLVDRDRRYLAGTLSIAEFDRISREVLGVLNPLQKQRWDSLLGSPCRFAFGPPRGQASGPGTGDRSRTTAR